VAALGIVIDSISDDFVYALDRAQSWGISHIEPFSLWGKQVSTLTDDEVDTAVAAVQARGITVTDIASLVMRCPVTDEAEAENFAIFDRTVEIARRFGTDRIRCYAYHKHPDLEAVWPRIVGTFEKLIARAEAADITLLLENSSYANLQWAADLRRLLDTLDHPRLQLLWDPGNGFALADPTPVVEGWKLLKDRIAHLHLKDSDAHGSNTWVPVGSGAFDLTGLLRAVKADGYVGVISLEAYFDDAPAEREEKVRLSVEQVQRAMTAAGLG
jgi:sugar phosphate isomerase/epimerase